MKIKSILVLSFILVAVFVSASQAGNLYIVKHPSFAAIDKETMKLVDDIIYSGDKDSVFLLILEGRVTMFDKGAEVYLIDVHVFSGYSVVRPKGSTQTYFIHTNNIKQKYK